MDLPTFFALVGGSVLALSGAAGFMWGFAKAKAAQTTIDLLNELVEARGKRITDLEAENERFDEKMTGLAANQHMLEQQNRDLRELVTGATAVHALGTEIEIMLEQRMSDLVKVLDVNGRDLRTLLREHANLVAERLTRIERISTDTNLAVGGKPPPPERASGNPLRG